MLFNADIDQFYLVTIMDSSRLLNINTIDIFRKKSITYLPREVSNMIQITIIDFIFVTRKGKYYEANDLDNFSSYNWKNFINLDTVYNLKYVSKAKGNEYIMLLLK